MVRKASISLGRGKVSNVTCVADCTCGCNATKPESYPVGMTGNAPGHPSYGPTCPPDRRSYGRSYGSARCSRGAKPSAYGSRPQTLLCTMRRWPPAWTASVTARRPAAAA